MLVLQMDACVTSLCHLQDSTEDGLDSSGSEPPPPFLPQLLVLQPPAKCSRQWRSPGIQREPTLAPVAPLQGFGLLHLQSLALMIDCLRLYTGLGSRLDERCGVSSTRSPPHGLEQLLAVLVTPEARVAAMRVLLLASNPAVGRADYCNASQGAHTVRPARPFACVKMTN